MKLQRNYEGKLTMEKFVAVPSKKLVWFSSRFVLISLFFSGNSVSRSNSFVNADKNSSYATNEVVCFADGTCRAMDLDETEAEIHMKKTSLALDECGVYMAPSTLGEATSMGIYTGKTLFQGEAVNFPEIAVPVLFREWGEHTPGFNNDGVLWDRYIWEGHVVQVHPYDNTNIEDSRAAFMPGVGCTVNSVLDMNNILSVHTSTYSTLGFNRVRDPGTGAFTPYHDAQTTVAVEQIEPGSELFASYGDNWIPNIPGAQVTFQDNMKQADKFLLEDFFPFIEQKNDSLTSEMKQALYEFAAESFPVQTNAAILSNLPRKRPWSDIEAEIIRYKAANDSSVVQRKLKATKPLPDDYEDDYKLITKEFHKNNTRRSIEWLKLNGFCQDHIKPAKSTIPQAGFGAFASRNLPAGTVVGYSPLIHIGIHGREIFTVDVPVFRADHPVYKKSKKFRKQYDLIINYSFGHSNSSVILTPYGGMVNYINHASEQTPHKPNVFLRWPTKELIAHKPYYLSKTPSELKDTVDKIGLSFEYVALRDILQGEEVFMDYGAEWEAAWNEHVQTWKPNNIVYDTLYVHSSEWNETTFRTLEEQEAKPYPPNLETVCYESYTSKYDADTETYYNSWTKLLRADTPFRVHCNVLERHEKLPTDQSNNVDAPTITYTIELIIPADETDDDEETDDNEPTFIVVHDVPPEGIILTDKIFTEDWVLPNAFRHEIMIPDSIMPKAWLNGPSPKPF